MMGNSGTGPKESIYGNPIPSRRRNWSVRNYRRVSRRYGFKEEATYPLVSRENSTLGRLLGLQDIFSGPTGDPIDINRGLIIGTIQMGYGHYRIGLSVASTAQAVGLIPYWFDLLAFDSPGARRIRDVERWYSLGSKWSQNSALFNRLFWDPLTANSYKRAAKNYRFVEESRMFTDVYKGLPPSQPFLATHPWLALAAVHAGMSNIVNMIPDNWPMGFHLAEGALGTVQGPSMYLAFRSMQNMGTRGAAVSGVPAKEIRVVGHYVDHELVVNIESDCNARIDRLHHKLPRRVLISVGGAGAQQQLLAAVVRRMLPMVNDGRAVLFINFGDHQAAWKTMRAQFSELDAAVEHTQWQSSVEFIQSTLTGPVKGVHVFLNEDPFAAVYTTNLLIRCSDILVTKPGELAYYPLPKLMLPHVGAHEAWGAVRSAELGDGTSECHDEKEVLQLLDLLLLENDLIEIFCENIIKLNRAGIYSGAYRVIELALERKGKSEPRTSE